MLEDVASHAPAQREPKALKLCGPAQESFGVRRCAQYGEQAFRWRRPEVVRSVVLQGTAWGPEIGLHELADAPLVLLLQLGERREDIFRVSKERAIHERLGVLVEEAELVNRLKDGAFTEDSPRGVV